MTARRMDKAWRDFQRWCRGKRLPALPAHPWTVAAYVRYRDRHGGGAAVAEALAAIGRAHILRSARPPHTHPLVQRTVRRLAERAQARPDQSALFADNDAVNAPRPDPAPVPDAPEPPPPRGGVRSLRGEPKLVRRRRLPGEDADTDDA
jgi:hypothetical protein